MPAGPGAVSGPSHVRCPLALGCALGCSCGSPCAAGRSGGRARWRYRSRPGGTAAAPPAAAPPHWRRRGPTPASAAPPPGGPGGTGSMPTRQAGVAQRRPARRRPSARAMGARTARPVLGIAPPRGHPSRWRWSAQCRACCVPGCAAPGTDGARTFSKASSLSRPDSASRLSVSSKRPRSTRRKARARNASVSRGASFRTASVGTRRVPGRAAVELAARRRCPGAAPRRLRSPASRASPSSTVFRAFLLWSLFSCVSSLAKRASRCSFPVAMTVDRARGYRDVVREVVARMACVVRWELMAARLSALTSHGCVTPADRSTRYARPLFSMASAGDKALPNGVHRWQLQVGRQRASRFVLDGDIVQITQSKNLWGDACNRCAGM